MRNAENIRGLWEIEPTHIGMIFHKESPRDVREELTGFPFNSEGVDPINTGVFVNKSLKEIRSKIAPYKLRAIQLHGEEDANLINELKALGMQVIKAFSIDEDFDFDQTVIYEDADYFLFDTKGKSAGGNGVQFDWSLLKNYNGKTPYILAGGIGPGQLEELKLFLDSAQAEKCAGIDLNSGFEFLPGIKNIEELKKFKSVLWT